MYSTNEYDYHEILRNMQGAYDNTLTRSQYISKVKSDTVTKITIDDFSKNTAPVNPLNLPSGILQGMPREIQYKYFTESGSISFPSIFQDILKCCQLPVQKDIMIMSFLTAYSSLLGRTHFYYRGDKHSANLFFMVVGESGSYKGFAEKSRAILKDVFAKYDQINSQIKMDFKKAEHRWKQEVKIAGKEGREPDYSMMPEKTPGYVQFRCADRTSTSQLINNFQHTQDIGMIMIESELGALVDTLGKEAGQFGAELRKAAMNEPISQHYISGGEPLYIPFPMLSFITATTPDVMVEFLRDTDNGFQARFGFVLTKDSFQFDEWTDDDHDGNLNQVLDNLSASALQMHEFFLQHPFEMKTTKTQKKRLNRYFQSLMNGISFDHMKGYSSVVKRTPIMLLRICCVLTAIRKYNASNTDSVYYCTDEDFDTALEIIKINILHSFMVITMLPVDKKKLRAEKARCPFQFMDVLRYLPKDFETRDFVLLANNLYQIPENNARQSLRRQVKNGYLIDTDYGKYRKTQKLNDYMDELKSRYFGDW